VADYHTYFVGCQEWGFSVWAHNTCGYLKFIEKFGLPDADSSWELYKGILGEVNRLKKAGPAGGARARVSFWWKDKYPQFSVEGKEASELWQVLFRDAETLESGPLVRAIKPLPGEGPIDKEFLRHYLEDAPPHGSRWGSPAVRRQNYELALEYQRKGWTPKGGAGFASEETLVKDINGQTIKAYPDITLEKDGKILRIQTVSTYADGRLKPGELAEAQKILAIQKPGDELLLIEKGTGNVVPTPKRLSQKALIALLSGE
jgi:hypothetical protein